ncbi:sigma factor [Streptomyces sp. NPDC058892]|uniref:sigma factor n=1 Tax=unclassified Streptomyces TaxID=2593676 RepID=UPI0036930773
MLGALSEAEDAVQEAWLRLERTDTSEIENLAGWLTTVVARICLNMLRSREARREEPLETRAPDPIVTRGEVIDPDVILRSDGGTARAGQTVVLRGAETAASQAALYRSLIPFVRPVLINSAAGAVVASGDGPPSLMAFTVTSARIVAIDVIVDPECLRALGLDDFGA